MNKIELLYDGDYIYLIHEDHGIQKFEVYNGFPSKLESIIEEIFNISYQYGEE